MNTGKILFMIINNEVKYLQNSQMDHKEWYLSLGLDPNLFETIIRGFIMEGKMVFYKGSNFNYDDEVMKCAKMFAPSMRITLNDLNLGVYCGVNISGFNAKWEPIVKINDTELTGFVPEEKKEAKKEYVERPHEDMIDFKNDYSDPAFRKRAILVTLVTLVIAILIKVLLISTQKMYLSKFGDFILMLAQIGLLCASMVSYLKQKENAKFLGIGAGIALLLMFDIYDIILGILYSIFSIDEGYYFKLIGFVKKITAKKQ